MPSRTALVVTAAASLAIALIVGVLWKPMWRAWTCVADARSGVETTATVVGPDPELGLVLALPGPDEPPLLCNVRGHPDSFSGLEVGQEVDVLHVLSHPGRCEFVSTVEASEALLKVLSSLTAALILGIVLTAFGAHRRLTRVPPLTSRFDDARLRTVTGTDPTTGAERRGVACPECSKPMREGMVPMLAGLNWREPEQPVGLPHALAGLPGTTAWRGRPHLHAYRCDDCEILLLKHGRDPSPSSPS